MIGNLPADFVRNANGKPKLAPERFKSALEIQSVCNELLSADSRRAPWRAAVDGLVNGNPVYSLARLEAKGQGWRARVNYRGAEGALQQRQTVFFDLVSEVNPCVEICLDYGKGVDTADWSAAIAKAFHWMLMKRWRDGYNFHVQVQQLEMLKHGLGFHVWVDNPHNWIPNTPLNGEILFPSDSKLNLRERQDYFLLRDFVPGFWLYQRIANEATATAQGWNVDAVWETLATATKNQSTTANRAWNAEQLQREMRAGDIGTTRARQIGVWVNHLFVREIDSDEITQYTVAENFLPNVKNSRDAFRGCLFRKRNKFPEWPVEIFPYDIGSGGILNTVRGLGARTKDFFELENRVLNAMADQVLVGSTMPLQQTGQIDPSAMKLARLGMMTILPRGLAPAQGIRFPDLSQGPIAFGQLLESKMQRNNQSYIQQTPEPVDRETGQSFAMRTVDAGQVGKGVHSLYASNWQRTLERIFRIASDPKAAVGSSLSAKLSREFQERCLKMKVPKEALQNVYEVNEVLSTGAGSPAARMSAMLSILKYIYPTTTEERKINIERDFTGQLTSGSKVDRYARSHDDANLPTSDTSLAILENDAMALGGDAKAASSQDQVQHAQLHLGKGNEIAQAVSQGQMDPAQGLGSIRKIGVHTSEHLQLLQSNPLRRAEFDALHKEWLALSQIADKLQQQVQQSQAAAQQQARNQAQSAGAQDSALQVGMAKVQSGERVGMAKVAATNRVALSKLAVESRIQAAKLANGSRNGSTAAR